MFTVFILAFTSDAAAANLLLMRFLVWHLPANVLLLWHGCLGHLGNLQTHSEPCLTVVQLGKLLFYTYLIALQKSDPNAS